MIAGLRIAEQMGVKNLQANVDSRLVANQVNETYVAKEADMIRYLEKVRTLTSSFKAFSIRQVPRSENKKAEALSKITSTSFAHLSKQVLVEELKEKSISEVNTSSSRRRRRYMDDSYFRIPHGRNPASGCEKSKGRPGKVKFLIVVIDYYTKWIEAKLVATITDNQIKKFVWDNIVYRFGLPREIISDNGKQFRDNPFKDLCEKLCICQHFAFVKHPQTNGLVERANRSLGKGIKARLGTKNKNWLEELSHVLWAHRTMIKSSNADTPFLLTYRTEAVIPAEIGMPTPRTAKVDLVQNNEALEINLDLMEEKREQAAIRKGPESDDGSVDTPLVSPFPHSDNDSDDEEVLNELSEYENAGTLRRERIINSFNGDDLAFEYFVVLEDIGEFTMSDMDEVLMGRPFRKITKLKYDVAKGLVSFTKIFDTYTYRMPRTIPRLKNFNWSKGCREVVRLPDLKLKTLGERGIECIFVGYAEHSKAFRFYVIEPNDSVLINCIIESRDAIFDENRISSVHRPSLRIPNGTKDIGGSVVSEEVPEEVIQQLNPKLRKSKRNRTPKNFMPEFQLYLIEGTRDEVSDQQSYCFNVEADLKTFDEAMKSWDGFRQKSRIDYFDAYAPVTRISTIRLLIAMASIHNLIIHQMNVKTAFLNGELDEEVDLTEEFLSSRFSMKDMGDADVILGIKIKHESNGIAISQSHYIKKVLKKFSYFDCTSVSTPMDISEKLMPNNGQAVSQLEYSRVIGCLIYVMTCTRLDIAFAMGKLSKYVNTNNV
ncbi:zinc finger, CCHC-type containing protein [Tanacetum coccineum]